MRLEFQIIHLLHPHYVKGHGCVYDHINWTVWFSRQDLMNDVNEIFNTQFKLEEKTEVSETLARQIWKYLRERKDVIGIYGTDYDRNILDIYKDLEDESTNRNW